MNMGASGELAGGAVDQSSGGLPPRLVALLGEDHVLTDATSLAAHPGAGRIALLLVQPCRCRICFCLSCTVGGNGVLVEPCIYRPDARQAFHETVLDPRGLMNPGVLGFPTTTV